ncbi:MAG: hypothetical protein ACLVB5_02260, partial [Christensenellales bacterium]
LRIAKVKRGQRFQRFSTSRFSVRLMLEDAAGLPDESAYAQKGRLTIDDADGAPCATLSFDRGGDGG